VTLPLPANWLTGNSFTATAENNVEAAVNALGAGTLPIPQNVLVSAASSLTLTTTNNTYVFSGSSATTWTLPAVSGNTGGYLHIENRGSAAISLVPAGADHIWFLSALTAMTIAAGGSLQLVNDGTYWNALSTDLANNSIGVLPVANGGTGSSSLTLAAPTVTGYTETVDTSMGTVAAGTTTIPALSLGTLKTVTLPTTGAVTFTMPTATAGQSFVLLVKQGASPGTATAAFTGVVWPNAATPVVTPTIGHFDMFTFICFGSSIWHGTAAQNYAT
jgi:hypothetical protein